MTLIQRYTFKNILFLQEELTYAEDGKVKKCLERLAGIFSGQITLADALATIYDEGIAGELFAVILKPNNGTIFHKLWNRFWAWKHGVNLSNVGDVKSREPIIAFLKNSEIMEVLADFFVLNTNWMNGLEQLKQASNSPS